MFALVMLQNFFSGLGDRLARDEEGATAVEYGLLVALIAAVIIATVVILGNQIQAAFQTIVDNMPGGAAA